MRKEKPPFNNGAAATTGRRKDAVPYKGLDRVSDLDPLPSIPTDAYKILGFLGSFNLIKSVQSSPQSRSLHFELEFSQNHFFCYFRYLPYRKAYIFLRITTALQPNGFINTPFSHHEGF
jgi:hypothetical protein